MKNALHDPDFSEQSGKMSGYPYPTVEKLYAFGSLLFSDIQQRANQIDSKMGVYLAFSAAVIAVLAAGGRSDNRAVMITMFVSGTLAVVSLLTSFFGLRSRIFAAPSYKDWFDQRVIDNHDRLLRAHVLAILASYQHQRSEANNKAFYMPIAEYSLLLSALSAVVMLILKLEA
jgi:Na+/melibiose symporter-like transporter